MSESQPIFALEQPTLAVKGTSAVLPVHRVYCVGQNYRDHALEMGSDPKRETPFFFSKPADALSQSNQIRFPGQTSNLHHEVELVVVLKSGGYQLTAEDTMPMIYGYAVGVDLTRRDLQAAAKSKGRPWDVAKGFDQSGPVSIVVSADDWRPEKDTPIKLYVNEQLRQQARLGDLIWSVPELIAELSSFYHLQAGDVIFTGTPAGVSSLAVGDNVKAVVEGLPVCEFSLTS